MVGTLTQPVAVNGKRDYPDWHMRGKIKKLDPEGKILEGQYACNGEIVRISPHYLKNGVRFRVRPERPAAYFAAFCHEAGLLPTLLTAEECAKEEVLEILDQLWQCYGSSFQNLESPFAACDQDTQPSHRIGFSFTILQILVEPMGVVKSAVPTSQPRTIVRSSVDLAGMQAKIDALRARANANGEAPSTPAATKAKK